MAEDATPETDKVEPKKQAESPALTEAREALELRKIALEQGRLQLDDRVARAEAKSKLLTGTIDSAKSALPDTFEVPMEKDTLAQQGDPVSLAAIYTGRASSAPADDVADRVVAATNSIPRLEILVLSDQSPAADAEVGLLLKARLSILNDDLDEVLQTEVRQPEGDPDESARRRQILGGLAATASLVPSAITLLSRLFAHQYNLSEVRIADPNLGLDLRVAGALLAKTKNDPTVQVRVARFWNPVDSKLLDDFAAIADRTRVLSAKVEQASLDLERAKSAQMVTKDALESARDRLLELSKVAKPDEATKSSTWQTAWAAADEDERMYGARLTNETARVAGATATFSKLSALQTEAEDFLSEMLSAPANGDVPLIRAIRGDWLQAAGNRVIVHVSALSAGAADLVETRVGTDKRVVLAGLTVEFAVISHDQTLLDSGAVDSLWGGSMSLDGPENFKGQRIDYKPADNQLRLKPAE